MSTTKYFNSGASGMVAFDLSLESVSLEGSMMVYRGTHGVDRVFVGSGLRADFTQSLGGADKLYFNGSLADFGLHVSGSVLRLRRDSDNTSVWVHGGASSLTTLVFLDGSVAASALRQHALGHAALPTPVGETSALAAVDVSASQLSGLSTVHAFATASGAVFGTVPAGAAMQLRGSSGVDTVYVKAGSQIDATQLLGGIDRIYMTGLMSDYTATLAGSVLTLTRSVGGNLETIRAVGGDQLIFADGTVSSSAWIDAHRNGVVPPAPGGTGTPGVPLVQGVTITSDAGADGFYTLGEVIQLRVTFSEAVRVAGLPLLELDIGGQTRIADYLGPIDAHTLSFGYTIGADNDANGISLSTTALHLNGAVIRTDQGEHAVLRTPALSDQSGHRVDTLAPDTPVMHAVTGDDHISTAERGSATVQGTTEAGARIELDFSSGFQRQVSADGSGHWSYQLTAADFAAMGTGGEIISASARDAAGNLGSPPAQRSIQVQPLTSTVLPNIELSDIAAGLGGFVIHGEASESESGWSVASAGDVNGDGLADLIIGAPTIDSERSYVVFGKADGLEVELSAVAAGLGGFLIPRQVFGDESGWSVAGGGDINGDGLADLIVSAYSFDAHAWNVGRTYVVFGKTDTAEVDLAAVAAGVGGFAITGQAEHDFSSYAIAHAGDVNGDGLADLIIGAHGRDAAGDDAGSSYVVFGKTDTSAIDLSDVAAGVGGFVIDGQEAYGHSGWSVSGAGDVNGDGLADLIVGAPDSSPAAGAMAGRSHVVFGKVDGTAVNLAAVAAGLGGFVIHGQLEGEQSGYSVAGAGDVNGDGLADLIVGAPAMDAGRSYVVFGKADGTPVDLSAVAAGLGGFVIGGQEAYDYAGYTVASAGDINGDGRADLIVGAPYSSAGPAGFAAGRSYVVFGKADGTAIDLSAIAGGVGGFAINGQEEWDQSGIAVASAGDVDGDGLADLIVGANLSDTSAGPNTGRSYVILSSQVGQGHFGSELAQLGTAGADTFTGLSGTPVAYGGAGDDTFVLNASHIASLANSRIDGGSGRDTVVFAADLAGVVDLRDLNAHALRGIEVLDMENSVANTLIFDVTNLRHLPDVAGQSAGLIHRVLINGDATDAVHLSGNGGTWMMTTTQVEGATTYDLYAHSANGTDRLWIEQGLGVVLF